MSLNDVLATLQQRGIKLGLDGDQLKIRAAKEAMTPDIKQLLLENKAALLAWARARMREQQDNQPIPPRAPDLTSLPLSFSQQRLWFLEQLDPGSAAYHIPAAAVLTGKLDLAILNRVFAELIARHESLRTTFAGVDGEARQIVHAALPFVIDSENFAADSSSAAGRAAIAQRVAEEARAPFDLQQGPLLRVRLLRLNPGSNDDSAQHLLLVTMHHIITDGWSINVMLGEIARLYVAFSLQQASPLAPLPIQYGDFACWQRATLTDDALKARLGYWQQQLAGVQVLELPTDFTRPAVRRGVGAQLEFDIDASTLAALKTIAQQRGVTLFVVLMAAYYALLHRYTGQSDICVGTPIAGRTRAELQNLIGFFVNTLALRCDVGGNISIDALIARVNAVMLDATTNQDVPFESVVESLALPRDMSTTPVFQAMLVLQNATTGNRVDSQSLGNLKIEALASDAGASKFDLTFNLHETGNQLHVGIEYDTDLFSAARIARMGRHFANLLRAFVGNTTTRIGDIDFLDASERAQILTQWNHTATDYPKCLHLGAQFDAVAAAQPHAIALDFGDQQISYGALDASASQLAHHLRALGMHDHDNIAICLPRSPQLITGIVAIIKANGAYVPLDPEYPDDRLSFMLADTRARLIVTSAQHAQRLRALPDMQLPPIVCLDDDADAIAQQPTQYTSPRDNGNGEQLAYVMYTSGSTGMPKGVMVPQRGITRLVKNTNYIDLGPDDATGHISNVSFDAATLEIWGALLNGGRIAGIDKDTLLNREKFKQALIEKRVSAMFITVTLFNLYVSEDPSMFASVKNLLVGGEALDPNKIRAVLAANPPARLLNGYGPTENTTFTCCYHITQLAADAKTVPLGFPLANTTTYVVDQYFQLAPIGVAGELVTGGDGVALGYLNRDDLNAQKFVHDPFATTPGAKLYRTGDVVRWRDDGSIEMLGRVDDQVKIRGFRIELGEIDAALGALPEVRECAVVVRNDDAGNKLLAAYVVPRDTGEHGAIISTIRQQLAGVLPKFMLPHAYVVLDALPLTSNGKLDRRALPAPDWSAQTATDYVAPRNATEQALAQLWQEVLGVERIGVFDSFFDLGGHSLLATRLITRIEQHFGVQLPLRNLFENPTIAGTCDAIATAQDSNLPPLTARDRDASAPLPLSAAQQRLWIIDQLQPGSPMYNIPFAARINGKLDIDAFERAINEVISRHETLRTRFGVLPNNDGCQIVDAPAPWRLPQFAADNDRATLEQRVFAFMSAPFDLRQGPLFRAQLLRVDADNHIFIACMHHIISDGWSMDVLLHEISTLYQAFVRGQTSPLPPLAVQYADYALWQGQLMQAGVYDQQRDYWAQQLAGVPTLQLPTDFARPPILDARGRVISFSIDAHTTRELHALAKQHNVTLYMTLLAVFQLLLARYSGQNDIAIGSPVANRSHVALEPLIGFFVNTLVLRTQLNLQGNLSELLAQVRRNTLDAYANQDLPFEQLVDVLNVPRELSSTPLFQAMFILQSVVASSAVQHGRIGELALSPLRDDSESFDSAAKFDLTLSMTEHNGGLSASLEYRTSLWHEDTMRALCDNLVTLLQSVVAQPALALNRHALLSTRELHLMKQQLCGAPMPLPPTSIAALFEQQVLRTPDHVAVIDGDATLTYTQLNAHANQLAHALIQRGIGTGDYIGVCLAGSANAITAILAIIKTGAAYVPMDINYPADRLQHMASNARMKIVVVDGAEKFPLHACELIDLGSAQFAPAQLAATHAPVNPGRVIDAETPLYVVYTSGSTGLPKGAVVRHRNEANLLLWHTREYHMSEADRVLVFSALGFDLTQKNLFAPLITGGAVVFTGATQYDPMLIRRTIARKRITMTNCAPSAFYPLCESSCASADESEPFSDLASLRYVLFGGEPIRLELMRAWFNSGRCLAQIVNMYGPTECTDIACTFTITDPANYTRDHVPIGRPNANVQLYVLDEQRERLPAGCVGELCIGGAGVGLGYLFNEALTAEKFIANPFGDGLLYCTGDLVRLNHDGELDFVSRIDGQVKIRGFRIELGEIESRIAHLGGVREAVVAAKRGPHGADVLVAYVVGECDTRSMRRALKQDLPDYMVPSTLVIIDRVPLTPNGKVDRNALPTPTADAFAGNDYVAPQTATERQLADIWSEVLGLPRIGIDDNFFEIGGHSLLAVKMISRTREACAVELVLTQAFEYPSVRELAQYIDNIKWVQASAGTPAGNDATNEDREEFEI